MKYGKASTAGLLVFLVIFLIFGMPAILNLREASPSRIQVAIEACPGVSERLRFVAGPISIGELDTLLRSCERQATLNSQNSAPEEVSSGPK